MWTKHLNLREESEGREMFEVKPTLIIDLKDAVEPKTLSSGNKIRVISFQVSIVDSSEQKPFTQILLWETLKSLSTKQLQLAGNLSSLNSFILRDENPSR